MTMRGGPTALDSARAANGCFAQEGGFAKFGQFPEVLGGGGEENFVFRAACTAGQWMSRVILRASALGLHLALDGHARQTSFNAR